MSRARVLMVISLASGNILQIARRVDDGLDGAQRIKVEEALGRDVRHVWTQVAKPQKPGPVLIVAHLVFDGVSPWRVHPPGLCRRRRTQSHPSARVISLP